MFKHLSLTEIYNEDPQSASFNWNTDTITINDNSINIPNPTGLLHYIAVFSGFSGSSAAYNGTLQFGRSALSFTPGGFAIIDTTDSSVTATPGLPTSSFINAISGSIVISTVVDAVAYESGDFEFTGNIERTATGFNFPTTDATTATTVEAFFQDNGGSRGASYAISGGKIVTTIQADSSKLDTTAVPNLFKAAVTGTPGNLRPLVGNADGSVLSWEILYWCVCDSLGNWHYLYRW